jgi:hypothetical protein
MMEHEQERMQQLLKQTMQPIAQPAGELRRDLWPGMLKRLEARPVKVPWFDWALLAAVAVWLVVSPKAIPLLLYYL